MSKEECVDFLLVGNVAEGEGDILPFANDALALEPTIATDFCVVREITRNFFLMFLELKEVILLWVRQKKRSNFTLGSAKKKK
tara:strand:+ start:25 stop:273 length:249 start_codon:yes stop_codon:yes gene_type:complete